MNRILVITTEPLPLPGGHTTGAGLRAWGLAEGLKSRGFPVTLATPLEGEQATRQVSEHHPGHNVRFFRRPELGNLIAELNPAVIVMQHWGLVYALPPLNCPLAIDLAGPHLLERQFWGNQNPGRDRQEKISALSRADFIICGGRIQRDYFIPFLRESGFDRTIEQCPIIPFSVPPDPLPLESPTATETTFIYGGAFLAWQNPERPLRWLLDEMDRQQSGRLLFYGGSNPEMDASGGKFIEITQLLRSHPRVEMRGWKPFDQLLHEYATQGHVALDLMERNEERELAYTTRTMIYLYCALPVIYNNYSEITELIRSNDCGWTLDPEDENSFRELVRSLIQSPEAAINRRKRAQQTALRQNWNETIEPLAQFCKNPTIRPKQAPIDTPNDFAKSETPPNVICRKTRLLKKVFPRPGRYIGIIIYIPVWIVCKYLSFQLNVTKSSRAHKK